jgi:NAD(P)-dependent dehydrogenase (short-subunit alcohol dehydrogenase family)
MTASVNGKIGLLHGAAYAASKHGLLGLMRTLAIETAKQGITVNAICPGPVRTRMNNLRVEHEARHLGKSVSELEATMTPIGRRLEPHEVAPLAVYLASREASVPRVSSFFSFPFPAAKPTLPGSVRARTLPGCAGLPSP